MRSQASSLARASLARCTSVTMPRRDPSQLKHWTDRSYSVLTKSNSAHQISYLNQEITALKHLDSEYIIRFYDILKTQNHFYLVVEYCDGGDLSHYIEKKKGLKE